MDLFIITDLKEQITGKTNMFTIQYVHTSHVQQCMYCQKEPPTQKKKSKILYSATCLIQLSFGPGFQSTRLNVICVLNILYRVWFKQDSLLKKTYFQNLTIYNYDLQQYIKIILKRYGL